MDLGARQAGLEIVYGNDTLPEAADAHRKLFPRAQFDLGSVSDVKSFPDAEVVIGGYPCQSFSLGGNRKPENDDRSQLFRHFARCIDQVNPRFFVAENVKGLAAVQQGKWLQEQIDVFEGAGEYGYNITWALLHAEAYGIPQKRKRVVIVGVRRDLGAFYCFPVPTHGSPAEVLRHGLAPYASHGDAIAGLPLWPTGEFYERPHDPEGHFSWYYLSRNRKARWAGPAFTVVANFRHITLHPASSAMRLLWSNLADGWKQRWEFSGEYEHLVGHADRPILDEPRRLSWRECAVIQTFPADFEPGGDLGRKFELIGNAVPPRLMEVVTRGLVTGDALIEEPPVSGTPPRPPKDKGTKGELKQMRISLTA